MSESDDPEWIKLARPSAQALLREASRTNRRVWHPWVRAHRRLHVLRRMRQQSCLPSSFDRRLLVLKREQEVLAQAGWFN
jgi:hypothetical protein